MGGDRRIQVKVRLYASLRAYLPGLPLGQSAGIELPPGATIGDAIDRLGIPRTATRTCFLNGLQRDLDSCLKDGDELALFPPIAGGG